MPLKLQFCNFWVWNTGVSGLGIGDVREPLVDELHVGLSDLEEAAEDPA